MLNCIDNDAIFGPGAVRIGVSKRWPIRDLTC